MRFTVRVALTYLFLEKIGVNKLLDDGLTTQ